MTGTIAVIKSRGVPPRLADEGLDGGTRNLTETVRAFTRHGLAVSIFSSSPDISAPFVEVVDAVAIHRLPVRVDARDTGIKLDVERAQVFARNLLEYPAYAGSTFDFLHTHHWTSAAPALLEERKWRRVHLHTPHLLVAEKLRLLGLPSNGRAVEIEHAALSKADRLIAVSGAEAKAMKTIYGAEDSRISVIPNGVSAEFMAEQINEATLMARLRSSQLRLVSVGRLARQKGMDILVRAVASAAARGLDVSCTVVGGEYHSEPGELSMLRELAARLGVAERLSFIGHRSTSAIVETLRASTVYVQPTRYESQGLAILEAMSVGLPVIATRLPALSEYFSDGINGLLIDSESPEAVVRALEFLAAHPDRAVTMGSANRELVKPMTWERACSATVDCLGLLSAR